MIFTCFLVGFFSPHCLEMFTLSHPKSHVYYRPASRLCLLSHQAFVLSQLSTHCLITGAVECMVASEMTSSLLFILVKMFFFTVFVSSLFL
jgi:hypothetical protein